MDAVNNADFGDMGQKPGISPAVLRAEVMLDRLHVSPGVIDGKDGDNFEHALATYEKEHNIEVQQGLNKDVWASLIGESAAPVLIEHELTAEDVKGPFYPDLPSDYAKLAKLPSLGYRTPSQKLGAMFHMSEGLLHALNPDADLATAGTKIIVADVSTQPVTEKVESVTVDKGLGQVFGLNGDGKILVAYPATIGSDELPSPSGTYKVKGVAFNPVYSYDPKNFIQGDNLEKLKLPPGPNNPVGVVFIALTKPTYGLHGTPDPEKVDKTASHGCVRMTNWDAEELGHLVKPGVEVSFKEKNTD